MDIKGFKVNFLGDSITEGVGVADRENCRYDKRLVKLLGLAAANNYGVSGTRLAHQTKPSPTPRHDLCFCGRAYNMDTTADMVIVYGGVNDYLHGDAPFGELGDKTPATFSGGVYFLMNYLRENYKGKPIVFLSPARCCTQTNDDLYPARDARKIADAKPLVEYVKRIEETAKLFDIPVLNLYETLGIDPHDKAQLRAYTADGLHFNDAGHEILAAKVAAFIESL